MIDRFPYGTRIIENQILKKAYRRLAPGVLHQRFDPGINIF